MLPLISIGPLSIPTPGLLLIIGFWLGFSLTEKHSLKFAITTEAINRVVISSLLTGILAARLVYVARFPATFLSDPISLISPNPNMLDLFGGLSGAALAALVVANRKHLGVWHLLDALTPLFAVFTVALALANFASGDAFGSPTDLPWAVELWSARRHPTQLYEAIGASSALGILWPTKHWIKRVKPGGYFIIFLVITTLIRLFCEAFRGDSDIIFERFRTMQFVYLLITAIGLWKLRTRLPEVNDNPLLEEAQNNNPKPL